MVIEKVFSEAEKHGNAVPVVSLNDSVRAVNKEKSEIVDRSVLRSVQTPQCFHSSVLKKAYSREFHPAFTDDASVVENAGIVIHLTEGEETNIKITREHDLVYAGILIGQ
jgi:2-C-methyl-D-erythritol 4-phosphate cytidylyltransferase